VSDGAELYAKKNEMSETVTSSQVHWFDSQPGVALPADYLEPRWYAAYTCANHEKRVREQLEQRSIESYLPLYEAVRRWKDRRMRLQLPLFPGYVFVRMGLVDRLRVLQVPSVVRVVGFNGHLAALPDAEIEGLKNGLAGGVRAEPHPFLTAGRLVMIKSGPLQGRQGILIRRKGSLRVVLSIDLIQRSIVVDVEVADVEPLPRVGHNKFPIVRTSEG
jgi:transcription antitermination factor NusG